MTATADELTLRALTDEDLTPLLELDGRAFLGGAPREFLDEFVVPHLELPRFTGVFDGDEIVGSAGIFSKNLTFPGERPSPVAAVTWVGVQPGYTGRGILRRLMTDQLHGLHRRGEEPVAILTASESSIYGRFGYGLAIREAELGIPSGLKFRPGTTFGPVRQQSRAKAWPQVQALHAARAQQRTGYLNRSEVSWNRLFADHEFVRDGWSTLEFALHADGYIAFRTKEGWDDRGPIGTLKVHEICALTAEANASLWNHVINYSLVREISYDRAGVDEPLQDQVVGPRSIRTKIFDKVWLRIVDLDRAIGLRSYSAPADVVVRVVDSFCPWNDGVWSLSLDTSGGRAVPSTEPAQLTLDVVDLGAAFLGGTRIARLAAAGRISGDPDAIAALDLALSTPTAPWCPEGF